MNDLHLPSDVKDSFQSHLEELFRRISTIVVLVVILTGIWSLSIDQILNHLLTKLDPCDGSCVNIFSPEESHEEFDKNEDSLKEIKDKTKVQNI